MKKLNNKGFLLVETLIVATFTLTVLVVLYIQFKNLVVNYNNSYKYNTVEGIYNLNAAKNYVSQYENPTNSLFNQLKASNTKPYLLVYNGKCANDLGLTGIDVGGYCESLMGASNIKTLLYANSDVSSLKTYVKTHDDANISENLKNFIKRIETESNKHRLIAEYKDGTFATINYGVNNGGNGTAFNYAGASQTFSAPETGYYRVELWGAQGPRNAGKGGYTAGEIKLNKDEKLYVYTGQTIATANAEAFNAGTGTSGGYAGGGATDVRLISGTWKDAASLKSRIMVAAGGGSGTGGGSATAGAGGGLYGNNGGVATGAQTNAGGKQQNSYGNGVFGQGGGGCGGGGGYYGGGGASCASGAGGGSSYISGYAGVNSINSSGTHTNTTKHYSGKYFINAVMTAGVNTGQGHALITYLGSVPTREYSINLSNVRYIKDCTNGNSINLQNHWAEIQAISGGDNVAKSAAVSGTVAIIDPAYVTDGLIATSPYTMMSSGNQCITLTLNKEYNLEEIRIWHYYGGNRYYKSNITSVAGNDKEYHIVRNNREDTETSQGFTINQNN